MYDMLYISTNTTNIMATSSAARQMNPDLKRQRQPGIVLQKTDSMNRREGRNINKSIVTDKVVL